MYSNNSKYIDIKIEVPSNHDFIDILVMIMKSGNFVCHVKYHMTCGEAKFSNFQISQKIPN